MDEFRKKLQRRQIILLAGLIIAGATILISEVTTDRKFDSEFLHGYIDGFQTGIVVAILAFLVFFFFRNMMSIKNPAKLKKLYISEMDERKMLIRQKSGSVSMYITTYGLAVGTAASGNVDDKVFFTLLGATIFVSLVHACCKLYYRNKL